MQNDFAGTLDAIGQRSGRLIVRTRSLATDTAVQAHPQWPCPRGIVFRGNLDDVVERDSVIARRQLNASGLLLRVRTARLEPGANLVDGRSGRDHQLRG